MGKVKHARTNTRTVRGMATQREMGRSEFTMGRVWSRGTATEGEDITEGVTVQCTQGGNSTT